MNAKTAIRRAPRSRRRSRLFRRGVVLLTALAIVLVTLVAATLQIANGLAREPARPLDTFSSNVLPAFSVAGFPSLDEQNRLHGWFFSPESTPKSTIILVHDQGMNRLQFGLDSAGLYEFLLGQGYCVLAFDLRRSGESEGEMSGYGYAEWADVLAAISYVRKNAVTTDVLLFGFGTGVTASLLALDQLPPAGSVAAAAGGDMAAEELLEGYPKEIRDLGFDQAYIKGLLLDTPCSTPDEYIRADCRSLGWFGKNLLQYTVPYAIRFSAGSSLGSSLVTSLSRCQLPVFLAYSDHTTDVSLSSVQTIVDERVRLQPDMTEVFTGSQPGFADSYLHETDQYQAALAAFLTRFFSE